MDSVLYRHVNPFNPGSNLFNARNGDSTEKHSGGPLPRLLLKGSIINWVPHFRLLGVTVDDKLTWTKHLSDKNNNYNNRELTSQRVIFIEAL